MGSPSTTLLLPRRHVRLRWLAVASALLVVVALARNASAASVTPVAGQPSTDCIDVTPPTPQSPSKASQAKFTYRLRGVAADASGDHLYVAESRINDSRIWKITPSQDLLESVAGGGTQLANKVGDTIDASQALLDPVAVALDPRAADVYIVDQDSLSSPPHLILKKLDQGKVRTVADLGKGQPLSDISGLSIDDAGNAYLATGDTDLLRFNVPNVAGVSRVAAGQINGNVVGVAVDRSGSNLFVAADRDPRPGALYKVDLSSSPPTAKVLREDLPAPGGVALDASGTRLFITESGVELKDRKVTEVDPASGAPLQGIGNGYGRPTGLAIVNRANEKVDVFVQDANRCSVGVVAGVAKYVAPSQPTSTPVPTTSPAADKKPDQLVAPTIPTGQTGTQTQTGFETQTQIGPQNQPQNQAEFDPSQTFAGSRADSGLGADFNPGLFAPRGDTGLGVGTAANNGLVPGGPTAPGPQFNAAPLASGPPPPPSPSPAAPLVLGGQPGASPNVGLIAGDGQPPRGAVRYAMVGQRDALPPVAGIVGVAVVAFFSCGLVFAARAEPGRCRARCRPRGAY